MWLRTIGTSVGHYLWICGRKLRIDDNESHENLPLKTKSGTLCCGIGLVCMMFKRKRGNLDDMKRPTEITAFFFTLNYRLQRSRVWTDLSASIFSWEDMTFIMVCNLLISIFTKLYIPAKFGFRDLWILIRDRLRVDHCLSDDSFQRIVIFMSTALRNLDLVRRMRRPGIW